MPVDGQLHGDGEVAGASVDSVTMAAVLTTEHDFPLAIPLQTSLLGFTVHGQGIVLYVGGAVAVSNAVTAVVGV